MRIKNLDSIKRKPLERIIINTLPEKIRITDYALNKGFKINELVRELYHWSYEWYGFLIAKREEPDLVVDIGLPRNTENHYTYTRIEPEEIEEFISKLGESYIINGWIHSHGDLNFREFSHTDKRNMETVLSFVAPLTRKIIEKKEISVRDLTLLVDNNYSLDDFKKGNLTVVTDKPVDKVKIFESVYGSFAYSIVIGDGGWHEQSIIYEIKPLLGEAMLKNKPVELEIVVTDKIVTKKEEDELKDWIKENIRPYSWRYYHTWDFRDTIRRITRIGSKKRKKDNKKSNIKNNVKNESKR